MKPDKDEKYVRKTPHQEGQPTQASRDKEQEELARKLPAETKPAEEWGERHATGKTIAQGGAPQDH
jgi:hypothetical protein